MTTHPLKIRNFQAYWLARLATTVAQNGMILVIGWQVYTIARQTMSPAGAAAQLGLIGLLQFVPLFLTTPITGYVADRFDRRWIARTTVTLQFCGALILALATYEGWISLPILYFVAVLLGLARAFSGPALGALAPNLVPQESLPTAIALSAISWQVGTIIGPAIGGLAYAQTPSGAYWLAVGLFGVAILCLMLIGKVPQPQRSSDHPLRQIVEGLAYVVRNKLVFGTITLDLFAVFLAGTNALLPIYAHDIFKVGPQGLSLLAAAPAVGALLVGLVFSIRPLKHNVGPRMLVSVLIYGSATVLFGVAHLIVPGFAFEIAVFALAIAGGADMFSVYIRQSLIQLYTPDAMRGRVGAVSQLTISASNELGEAESGFLASMLGPVGAVLVGGGGAIVVTILWTYLFPSIKNAKTFDPPSEREMEKLT
jgi:MFS family permease